MSKSKKDSSTLTKPIKLIAVGETSKDRTASYNYLKRIAADLTQMGNEIIRTNVCNQYELDEIKKLNNINSKVKAKEIFREKYGAMVSNMGYNLQKKNTTISSDIKSALCQDAFKKIENSFYDILQGKVAIPSYRKTSMNIPLRGTLPSGKLMIYKEGEDCFINFPLSSSEKSIHKEIKLKLHYGRDKSGNEEIVNRILSGEYKINNSEIQIKNDDFYLSLAYTSPNIKLKDVIPDKVMGIDLGINRLISIYIDGVEHQPTLSFGDYIQEERMKYRKQLRLLQKTLKFAKGGHGRKRKMLPMKTFNEKESNWAKTMNHKASKEVIDAAQKHNVGIIKMEDLTGVTKNKDSYYFRSWAYYQLQTYIEYKAKKVGIKILWVNPKDTSRTCFTCKNVDKENRNDKDKTKFSCVNIECDDFGKLKDADFNAAQNITYSEGFEEKPKSKKGKLKKLEKKSELEVELT